MKFSNPVPENGDVIIHYYLPSGARIELQVYFSQGENPEQVLQRLFESENITYSILPEILIILNDLFQTYRRTHPTSLIRINNFTNNHEQHPWKKFSFLFKNDDVELDSIKKTKIEETRLILINENLTIENTKTKDRANTKNES